MGAFRSALRRVLVVLASTAAFILPALSGGGLARAEGFSLKSFPVAPVGPTEAWSGPEAPTGLGKALRRSSAVQYEDLGEPAALALARRFFPRLASVSGETALSGVKRVTGYPTRFTAKVTLSDGKPALIDSLFPLAVKGSNGADVPVDLALEERQGAFWTKDSAAPVRASRRLGQGVALPSTGIALYELAPLQSVEGDDDGASVIYANAGPDTDAVVKPMALGFDLDVLLRSARSPHRLRFRVGGGTRLEQTGVHGAVRVVHGDRLAAVILPPVAEDADGGAVPVAMTSRGSTIELTVSPGAEPLYPISVDPTVIDSTLEVGKNWEFQTTNESMFRYVHGSKGPEIEDLLASVTPPNHANFNYYTQGESHIYKVSITDTITEPASPVAIDDVLAIRAKGGASEGSREIVSGSYEVCSGGVYCEAKPVTSENREDRAFFEQQAVRTPGIGSVGHAVLESASVGIVQEQSPKASFNTSATVSGKANMGDASQWVNSKTAVLAVNAFDPGIGIDNLEWALNKAGTEEPIEWKSAPSSGLPKSSCAGAQCNECYEPECPTKVKSAPLLLETGTLPEGEDSIDVRASDALGLSSKQTEHVKIDNSPPTNLFIRGIPTSGQIGESNYPLTVGAADGSTVVSSGLASLTLIANGVQVGSVHGCSPGPCTAAGKVVLPQLGEGKNTIALVATDNAGNTATKEVTVTVSHAGAISAGPVAVNPITGAATLSANDIDIPVPPAGALTLTRSYDSRQTTAGSEGVIGSQWQLNMNPSDSLQVTSAGATLYSASGTIVHFTHLESGSWEAPKGDQNLTLSEVKEGSKVKEYVLKDLDDSSSVRFTQPEGGEAGAPWRPTIAEGRNSTDVFTYSYTTEKISEGHTIVKPTEELAPVPSGVSCSPTLQPGCRALQFTYATSTTATGENKANWGSYKGRLAEVDYVAYNTATKKMVSIPVAAYEYDSWGRLRAEWNPSISPALKTTYGYDTEGYEAANQHLTAVTQPDRQPLLLRYGSDEADPASLFEESNTPAGLAADPGRLLSVIRPGAETAAGNGDVPEKSSAPTLSSKDPVVGTTLSVSSGSWKNSPLAYGYQWERCLAGGGALCSLIPGAVNQSFTPTASDAGDYLVAVVTALNGTGAARAATTASNQVEISVPDEPTAIGKAGSGKGEFTWVGGLAFDSSGNLWATDPGNDRVQEFNNEGKWLASYGVEGGGTGTVQFREPTAIAISQSTGDVYITDRLNDRIEEIGPKGEYIRVFGRAGTGQGELEDPDGITFDSNGDVWVSDTGNNRLEEFTAEGAFVRTYGKAGSGSSEFSEPTGITFTEGYPSFAEGTLDVVDRGNDRIDQITLNGFSFHSFGEAGKKKGEFKEPSGITAGAGTDTLYVTDGGNDRVEEFNPYGEYIGTFGKKGTKVGDFEGPTGIVTTASGVVYVADSDNDRIQEFQPTFSTSDPLPTPPEAGESSIWTVDYSVPVAGTGAPNALGATEVAAWAQKDDPTEGTAVFPPDEPMGWPAKQYTRATITYLDANGNAVNQVNPSGGVSTAEYNEFDDVVRTLSPDDRARALGEGSKSAEVAERLDSKTAFSSQGNQVLSTEGPEHEVKLSGGSQVQARAETTYGYNEGAPSEGGPYNLPTLTKSFAAWSGGPSEVRETKDGYGGESGATEGWKLREITSVVAQPHGAAIGHEFRYNAAGQRLEERNPGGSGAKSGSASPTTIVTTYYTAGASTEIAACGYHPEWAGLACDQRPAVQPHTAHTAELPEVEAVYNVYGEPETVTETFGSGNVRKVAYKYDEAGRLISETPTASSGEPLPAVTDSYNAESGVLETQSTTVGSKTEMLTGKYNKLGELVSYTDGSGNTATYRYNADGEVVESNDGKADKKGIETFEYGKTSGLPVEMTSTACSLCKFTATWDAEGKETSETLPNGMTVSYGYNSIGTAVSVTYKKTSYCTEEKERCIWFKDSVVPSIHNQWMSQESSLAHVNYGYDELGRLTQVQETPAGGTCVTRKYSYDEEGNRLSLATIPAGAKGECASSGGTTESHTYDSANRLTDAGVAYNAFGDTTALPAADAGEQELTSKYFVDGQVASQTQGGLTIGYTLDPAKRPLEVIETGSVASDVTNHYTSPGAAVSWTSNAAGEQTQNLVGLDGRLVAVQNNSEAPVLEIVNLHGDVVGTASLSETAEKLASSANTTEYGVPSTASPSKYSWLGAIEMPTEFPSGIQEMGVRSYVPKIGRFLQPDPVVGGSANAYGYTFDDPIDTSDPSGEYTIGEHQEAWTLESTTAEIEAKAKSIKEAEEAAARARAEAERLREEAELAAELAGAQYAEEWEEWGWYEGEEGYEYVADRQHETPAGEEEARERSSSSGALGEGAGLAAASVPICRAGSGTPCAEFEVMTEHMSRRVFRITCKVVAALAIGCGGDDFMQREHEYEVQHPPAVVVESRPGGGPSEEDIIEESIDEGILEDD